MSANRHFKSAVVGGALLAAAGHAGPAGAQSGQSPCVSAEAAAHDSAQIREVLASYNAALNGGKTEAVLPLYTEDGIFMAPYSPSFVGKAAIRKAYDNVFQELQFSVVFHIAEMVVMAPDWAFVRTNSVGTTLHHSTGRSTSEANQELFIFHHNDDGQWRIARYSFSPIHPPGA
jgi:uncharacterized protein (TIGR02246 family)